MERFAKVAQQTKERKYGVIQLKKMTEMVKQISSELPLNFIQTNLNEFMMFLSSSFYQLVAEELRFCKR